MKIGIFLNIVLKILLYDFVVRLIGINIKFDIVVVSVVVGVILNNGLMIIDLVYCKYLLLLLEWVIMRVLNIVFNIVF